MFKSNSHSLSCFDEWAAIFLTKRNRRTPGTVSEIIWKRRCGTWGPQFCTLAPSCLPYGAGCFHWTTSVTTARRKPAPQRATWTQKWVLSSDRKEYGTAGIEAWQEKFRYEHRYRNTLWNIRVEWKSIEGHGTQEELN